MPFRIDKIGSLSLPEFIERGQTQSMGAGRAATDFVQLPGGGHYDNYGDFDSPRELSPLNKRTVFYDTGVLTIREQVEALRAMLGKRERIEVLWHDGEVRWTWGRLFFVDHVRDYTAVTSLPVNISIMPAEGIFYAEEEVEEETVFSGATMDEDVVIDNDGTVESRDPIIEYVSPLNDDIVLTIENEETSQKVVITVLGIEEDETIILNVGNRTARLHKLPVTISTISRSGITITVNCGAAHGFSGGEEVVIRGTSYDGFYEVDDAPDSDTITVLADPLVKAPNGPESPVAGLLAEVSDLFGNVVFSDEADWFWIVAGSQTIHVTADVDMDGGTFRVTYNPAYA